MFKNSLNIRSLFLLLLIFSFLKAETAEEKRLRLQKQLQELEEEYISQKQHKEIEAMEARIRHLEQQTGRRVTPEDVKKSNATNIEYDNNKTKNEVQRTQYQTPQQTQQRQYYEQPRQQTYVKQDNNAPQTITDEDREKQVHTWFGKNRNGVLIGLSVGGMGIKTSDKGLILEQQAKGNLPMFGLKLGYQQFLGIGDLAYKSPIGMRFYIDSYAGYAENDRNTLTMLQVASAYNIDILLEKHVPNTYSYLGAFLGIGYGVTGFIQTYTDTSILSPLKSSELLYSVEGMFYNLGLALTLAAKHRFEFYYKILPKKKYDSEIYYKSTDLITFAYQYTF